MPPGRSTRTTAAVMLDGQATLDDAAAQAQQPCDVLIGRVHAAASRRALVHHARAADWVSRLRRSATSHKFTSNGKCRLRSPVTSPTVSHTLEATPTSEGTPATDDPPGHVAPVFGGQGRPALRHPPRAGRGGLPRWAECQSPQLPRRRTSFTHEWKRHTWASREAYVFHA
jgi:hypothetical protein